MSMNFDTLFGPYQDKTVTLYSYDWVDVDSATGYVAYDGALSYYYSGGASVASYYIEKSSERSSLFSYGNYGYTLLLYQGNGSGSASHDYDTGTFKKARTLRGKAIVKVPIEFQPGGVDPHFEDLHIHVTIYKVNGGVETQLATVESPHDVTAHFGSIAKRIYVMPIDIPESTIAEGELIRITVDFSWNIDSNGWFTIYSCHDPQDEVGALGTGLLAGETRIIFILPYKIEAVPNT